MVWCVSGADTQPTGDGLWESLCFLTVWTCRKGVVLNKNNCRMELIEGLNTNPNSSLLSVFCWFRAIFFQCFSCKNLYIVPFIDKVTFRVFSTTNSTWQSWSYITFGFTAPVLIFLISTTDAKWLSLLWLGFQAPSLWKNIWTSEDWMTGFNTMFIFNRFGLLFLWNLVCLLPSPSQELHVAECCFI